jgi:hypothetical protein
MTTPALQKIKRKFAITVESLSLTTQYNYVVGTRRLKVEIE